MWAPSSCRAHASAAGRWALSGAQRQRGAQQLVCRAERQTRDPKSYTSMDELRDELEAREPGLIVGLVNWLSDAAQSTAAGTGAGTDVLKGLFRKMIEARESLLPKRSGSWDEELAALDRLEEEVGAERVQRLSVVLLGTRQSTLRIIQRYPAMLDMQPGHLMERLVWFKELFPDSDVSRMVELQPAGFLGGEWAAVQRQLSAASGLLREGLRGADFAFMFQEDPAILFEEPAALELGIQRLRELWEVDDTALANSSPLHLTLAVRALGPNGPPKKY